MHLLSNKTLGFPSSTYSFRLEHFVFYHDQFLYKSRDWLFGWTLPPWKAWSSTWTQTGTSLIYMLDLHNRKDPYRHLFDGHEVGTLPHSLKNLGKLRIDECIIWNINTKTCQNEAKHQTENIQQTWPISVIRKKLLKFTRKTLKLQTEHTLLQRLVLADIEEKIITIKTL